MFLHFAIIIERQDWSRRMEGKWNKSREENKAAAIFFNFFIFFCICNNDWERQERGQVNGRIVEDKSRSANICRANFLRETKNPRPS